jgi:uncharacterized hydrophobic protein (TIGR00271 family)
MSDPSGRGEEFLGQLRVGRSLTTMGHVLAVGLALLVGLLFLEVGQTMPLAGPWSALAGVLAGLVLGLTLLSVLELMGGSGERGGTYVLIQETWGGLGAFLAGRGVLAAAAAMSAALTQSAADHLLSLCPSLGIPAAYVALALFLVLILAQLAQVVPSSRLLRSLVLLLSAAFAATLLSAVPRVDLRLYRLAPPVGLVGLVQATAALAGGYIVFEAILISRRQARDPGRLLPRAILHALVIAALALALVVLVAAGLTPFQPGARTGLVDALAEATFMPRWTVGLLAVIALLLASEGCLVVAARQTHALSRDGGLPLALRHSPAPFSVPPLLFAALALFTAPMILWAPPRWLVGLAAALFLVAMTLLNVAAVYSHQTEPARRRRFVVPFHPLVPGIAIATNVALLWSFPLSDLLGGGLWLCLGLCIYLGYARHHQVAAREGIVVFGREPAEERAGAYRILVPLGTGEERHILLRLAVALARQLDGEVIPLQVIPVRDPLAIEEGRRIAQERNTLFRWSTSLGADARVPVIPITRLARSVSHGILDSAAEENCDLILMAWPEETPSSGARMGHVLDPVVRQAPCDVTVVAYHAGGPRESKDSFSRLLVPTAGGPHAPLATRLALLLAREHGATVTAVWVAEPAASPNDIAVGRGLIRQTIADMRQQMATLPRLDDQPIALGEIPIESQVIAAESVVAGIVGAGAENDLVLIGASEESLIDQVLFGTVAEQVARECPAPVVMVKRYRGLSRFWLQRLWDALVAAVPQLGMEERAEVYREVRRQAQPDADFFVMMGLSAIIATLGLLQSSAAVIIGAMLVAPLFTPILALSCAIVRSDARLLRLAVESALKGIVLAIGAALLLAAVSPLKAVTPEIAARIRPSILDLAVALVSGAAGAYAVARKDVAASLPGVAIAAALMPPLCTVGIGLAMADLSVAGGGGLLFATNLVAIVLAGSLMLLVLGFRPVRYRGQQVRLRMGLVTTAVLLIIIAIPLGAVFVQSVKASRIHQVIRHTLEGQLEAMSDVELVSVEVELTGGEMEVTASVYAPRTLPVADVTQLRDELTQAVGRPLRLRLATIPAQVVGE